MKKNFLLFALLVFVSYSASNVSAKDSRHTDITKNIIHNPSPVKNIPPQVLAALKDVLSRRFDIAAFDPTLSKYNIIWSRHRNVFHVVVTWPTDCGPGPDTAYLSADIKANGDISDFIYMDTCGGPIPL